MYTLTPVTTPAELGPAANQADMDAWNRLVADHPDSGQEVSESAYLALLDQASDVAFGAPISVWKRAAGLLQEAIERAEQAHTDAQAGCAGEPGLTLLTANGSAALAFQLLAAL